MVFDNLEVNHKAFGCGSVVAKQGKYLTVKFGTFQKIFVYPEAFEGYLTLSDGSVPKEIVIDIENAKREKQIIIDKKKEENFRAMTRGIVIPGKEGVIGEQEEDDNNYKPQESEEV